MYSKCFLIANYGLNKKKKPALSSGTVDDYSYRGGADGRITPETHSALCRLSHRHRGTRTAGAYGMPS